MNAALDEIPVQSVFYRAIIAGRLNFLIVQNGYRYQLHDVLRLAEAQPDGSLTSHICYVQVMFIISDPTYGIREGYAVLSIKLKIQSSRVKASDLVVPKKTKE